ncbi:MAG: hypothetical protein JWP83_4703 [Mycobacterium sp.]|jgi:hypothetical protein|uniref:DUF1772 domain-containing protein n=1 Tax=Mycobacterium sp. TaxID=1785 RepID=UPI00260A8267|nr:DUF1772 domain-containing protein [Mycobacterium sp.]MCW2663551.1 hypothetical protein [Mycobacterium sp.]
MTELARLAALIAVLGTAVVFGTDVFCAMVQRPALALVDDRALVAVMGNVHRYGDRRMPVPGVVGLVAAAVSALAAAAAGRWTTAAVAATAVALLLVWLVLYLRVSAPINRQLTAAAEAHDVPANARALQANWDRVITARGTLQGLAVCALCVVLMV